MMGFFDKVKKALWSKREDEEYQNSDENFVNDEKADGTDSLQAAQRQEIEMPLNHNILFVCATNTTISPMAEAIFNQFSGDRQAFSAGLNAQSGNRASQDAIKVCQKHGIELSDHLTANINDFFLDDIGLILTSTAHIRDTLKMKFSDAEIFTIREYAGGYSDLDISDPFAEGLAGYVECFMEINAAVIKIIRKDMGAESDEIVERPIAIRDESIPEAGVLSDGRFIVVSGLDGNLDYYNQYLSLWDKNDSDCHIVFLGNLIYSIEDDDCSLEILDDAIEKSKNYSNFHYLLGINELSCILGENVYKMGINLKTKFENLIVSKKGSLEPYLGEYVDFFKNLPYFAKTENGLFLSYSGPSGTVESLEEIGSDLNLLHDFLWARKGEYESEDVEEFLDDLGLKFMVVGNRPCDDGYDVFSRQLIISSSDSGENKSYLDIDLGEDIDSMDNLVGCLKSIDGIVKVDEDSVSVEKETDEKPNTIKNFRYLDDLIHSGAEEVVLDSDIVLGDDEKFEDGIKLDADGLVIDGNGHTIDACGKARIFYCLAKCTVIKNIALKNGFAEDNDGGAIFNEGILYIFNSTFIGNIANGTGNYDGGGAIFNQGELSIIESTFATNMAEDDGGAIFNKGKLTISNSSFAENMSNGDVGYNGGGAIFNFDTGVLNIEDSTFDKNMAKMYGGAIRDVNADLSIRNSTFSKNMAKMYGGALYNDGCIRLCDVNFDNNISESTDNFDVYNSEIGRLIIKGNSSNQSKVRTNYKGYFFVSPKVVERIDTVGEITQLKLLEKDQKDFNYLNEIMQETNEIKLENDIVLNIEKNEDEKFKNGINIDRNDLVIDGNGHSIDAQGLSHIFQCNGKNIQIKNITLKNGFTIKEGGAIHNTGELKIIGSTLAKNTAHISGGALCNKNGCLSVFNTKFVENKAEKYGGAIHNKEGKLSIDASTLKGNMANGTDYNDGGGSIYNSNGSVLCITKSTFDGNNTKEDGGAIFNKGELSILNTTFVENITNGDRSKGGAIVNWYGGELNISKSIFKGNRTTCGSGNGGAIYNYNYLNIAESIFTGNMGASGGAICNDGNKSTITETTFNDNKAREYGGAIKNDDELIIKCSKIIGNKSNWMGGAIHNGGNLKIFDCEVLSNDSPGNTLLNKDFLQVYNTNFRYNKSEYVVLNDKDDAKLGIFNGEFIENNVEESVICNSQEFCSINRSKFKNNIFSEKSVNIINKGNLTLTGPKIEDEAKIINENHVLVKDLSPGLKSKIYGDGILEFFGEFPEENKCDFGYLDKKIHESDAKEIILDEDICFENYERDFYEGGIELDIDNLVIDGNGKTIDASDKTRIFIITGKNITLKNITFKNGHVYKNYDNQLNNYGGAIKINQNANLKIKNCEFINNASEEDGGAIHNNSELTIAESIFSDNSSKHSAGAIKNDGELSIMMSKFNDNQADNGGAIHNLGDLSIKESTFEMNKSSFGGAISNWRKLIIIESIFAQNTVKYSGGAIYSDDSLNIINSTFNSNRASHDGGAIENSKGCLNIEFSKFDNNITYVHRGGAIKNSEGGKANIVESFFKNNNARTGGAICNEDDSILAVINSTFTENIVDLRGGAIGNWNGKLTIMKSDFNSNIAESYGGALENYNGEMNIVESLFKYNSAKKKSGGAINNIGGKLGISNSIFAGNDANRFNGNGSAINNDNAGDFKLNNCTFNDNQPNDVGESNN